MDQTRKKMTIAIFEKEIKDLCIKNQRCTDSMCNKLHPRCFTGICIEGLQTKKNQCSDSNCKLKHFFLKDLRNEYNIDSINGIFRFNLCPQNSCPDKNNCPFIHIKWAEKYCVSYFVNDCDEEQNHDGIEHLDWVQISDKIHQETSIDSINPENLCLQSSDTCKCKFHLPNTENFCLIYFKGLCPNLKCLKSHISWEDYLKGLNSKEIIQNCITLHKINPIPKERSEIFLKQQELIHLRKEVVDSGRIDIIFIMDCTGSMGNWITESSKQIYTTIDNFQKQIGKFIRVGFIGYRDLDDKQRFSIYDLTSDLAMIKQFISNLKAEGGGDEAEDVFGALEQVFRLNITSNKESTLITFLFADAPTHGTNYHEETVSDSYPKQTDGSLENLMQKYYKLKEKNLFYCVKINTSTDKMFQIMQQNFPGLVITEEKQSKEFPEIVSLILKESYTKATHTKITQRPCKMMGADYYKPKSIPNPSSEISVQDKINYWKEFPSNILKKYYRTGHTELIIYTQQVMLKEQGTQCYVYEIKDRKNNRKVLAKISKYVVDEYKEKSLGLTKENQDVELSETTIQKQKEDIQIRFEQLVVARQLAKLYRQKTKKIQGAPPIYYVSPIIYKLYEPFMGLLEIYAETYIDKPTEWIKYSNNDDHVHSDHYYMTSFSHFTFQETEGLLLINDLQGKFNILSDPSIQTAEQISGNSQKDKTNDKLRGIVVFQEKQHQKCNEICKQLGLKSFKHDPAIDPSLFKYENNQPTYFICENCNEFRDMTQEQYKKINEEKCEFCLEEENLIDLIACKCCRERFQIPSASYHVRETQIDKCSDCKTRCYQINLQCCYCNVNCAVKVQNTKIGGQEIPICKKASQYLNAMQCQKCYSRYDYTQLIKNDDYERGYYKCDKCKRS